MLKKLVMVTIFGALTLNVAVAGPVGNFLCAGDNDPYTCKKNWDSFVGLFLFGNPPAVVVACASQYKISQLTPEQLARLCLNQDGLEIDGEVDYGAIDATDYSSSEKLVCIPQELEDGEVTSITNAK